MSARLVMFFELEKGEIHMFSQLSYLRRPYPSDSQGSYIVLLVHNIILD